MKKILTFAWLVAAILLSRSVTGQQVTKAEYFFDSDPGIGKGTAITVNSPGDSIDVNTSVSTTGLLTGFHALFVRVKESNGKWSLYQGQNFYIYPNVSNVASPRIKYAEYFIDNDPGVGKGNSVAVTAGDSIDVNSSVSTTGLAQGFHALFVRVKDSVGRWSLYQGQNFYLFTILSSKQPRIKAAEYFIDSDPGVGKGTAVSVSAGDSVDINSTINLTGLNPGFHALFVRVKDSVGRWSLYQGQNFYLDQSVSSASYKIVRAEAFFDTDPGFGNGIAVSPSFAPADSVDLFRSISAAGLALGGHNLFIRVQNDSAQWSMALEDTFTIANRCIGVSITSANTQICRGDSATIMATGGSGYDWNNGDTTATIKVSPTKTDTFYVQVSNTGCISDTDFAVTVNQLPNISISASDNVLTASGGTSYVWNTGGTNDTIVVHKTGRYFVTATDAEGCSDTASYYIVVTGIAGVNSNSTDISLYPNPNNGEFTLAYNLSPPNAQLQIIDITGRVIYEEHLTGIQGSEQVNASTLTNGLFFWQVIEGNEVLAKGKMTVIK